MGRRLPLLCMLAWVLAAASGCTPLPGTTVRPVSPTPPDTTGTALAASVAAAQGASAPSPAGRADADISLPRWAVTPPLSPGDRLQVNVQDGDGFSGRYEVGLDGTLKLPYLSALPVAGRDTGEAEQRIADALVAARYFKPHRVRVSVLIHEWSHVQVHVSGAVFDPGMVTINVRTPDERALKSALVAGDFPSERMLAAALRAAGGVRPDAALDTIRLLRNGRTLMVSYAGLMAGDGIPAIPLMSGDTIVVPSTGRFDPALVAPSAITPPGIRVFLSNLTVPATGNTISAISKESSSLPYGARLLTAAFSANCVGGVSSTSAARHAVLVRTDPVSGHQETLERSVKVLLDAPHRDDVNPLLMPNDAISCYDSGVTNLRDIARSLYEFLLPFSLL